MSGDDLFERFRARVARGLGERLDEARSALPSAAGGARGGGHIRAVMRETRTRLQSATDWTFSEVARLPGNANIHREESEPFVAEQLNAFLRGLFDASEFDKWRDMPPAARTAVESQRAGLAEGLAAEIAEWRAGLGSPRGAEVRAERSSATTNIAIVHGNVAGGLQQGGAGSHQESTVVTVNQQDVGDALERLMSALATVEIDPAARSDIEADADTIRSQLRKASPDTGIVTKAAQGIGSAVFNLGTGVAAALLTPHAQALLTVLGVPT